MLLIVNSACRCNIYVYIIASINTGDSVEVIVIFESIISDAINTQNITNTIVNLLNNNMTYNMSYSCANASNCKCVTNSICSTTINNLDVRDSTCSIDLNVSSSILTSCRTSKSN